MAALQGMRQHAAQVYGLLDGLAGQYPDDPQVTRVAAALETFLPDGLATPLAQAPRPGRRPLRGPTRTYEDLDPAQAMAVRRALELVQQRQEEPV